MKVAQKSSSNLLKELAIFEAAKIKANKPEFCVVHKWDGGWCGGAYVMDNDSNCAQSIGTENPKCQFNFIQKRRRRWLHRFFHQGTGWQCKREEQLLLPLKRTYPGALMHHNSGWWEARWSWSARRNWTSWYCSSCGKDVGFWWWWPKINDGSM